MGIGVIKHKNNTYGGLSSGGVVDTSIIEGSTNAVSGGAVFEVMSEKNAEVALSKSTLGYISKNLIPYPYDGGKSLESLGITYTDNNGIVTVSGTATGLSTFSLNARINVEGTGKLSLPKGKYILSGNTENVRLVLSKTVDNTSSNVADTGLDGEPVEFEITEDVDNYGLVIAVNSGLTVDTEVKPMIRRAEIKDDTYKLYTPSVRTEIDNNKNDIAINKSTLGYERKNLLHYPYIYSTRTIQGVDWIDNGDGTITANGTNTDTTAASIFNCVTRRDTTIPLFLNAGKYILNGCPTGGSDALYRMQVGKTTNDAFEVLGFDYGYGVEFTLTETTQIQIQLLVGKGATVDNVTFKPMIRYAEIEDGTWEQYVPSVRTEIDDTKSNVALNKSTLGYECKNLVPYPYHTPSKTQNGIEWVVNNNGSIGVDGTADATTSYAALVFLSRQNTTTPFYLKKGKYILTGCPADGSDDTYSLYLERSDASGNYQYVATDFGDGVEFEIKEGEETLPMQLAVHVKNGATVSGLVFYPMIRCADIEDDKWEAYKPSVDVRLDVVENTMCTTAVANKTATEIILDEIYAKVTDGGNVSQYMIKNGVCYITLDFMAQSDGSYTISNLPKSEILLNEVITPFKSTSYVESGAIVIGVNGLVALHNLVTGQRYLTQISYPVAE